MNTDPSHVRPQSDDPPSHPGGPPTDPATRYRTLFDALEEGFCVFEMIYDEAGEPVDYRFKEINRAFTAQTGLREEDVKSGRTMLEMAPSHEKCWFERYGRVAKTGEPITIEDRADALGRWYSVHAFRIGGEGSVEVGALFKDVTEDHEKAQAQAEERARQDRTLENAEVATFDLDVPGDRVYANGLLARFFGISEADAAGGPLAVYFDAIHPDDRERTSATIARSLETGGRYEIQYRVVGSDGRERTVLARGDTTLDPEGRALRLSGVVLDITERVRTEEALRESERRRTLALDSGNIGSWNIDLDTSIMKADARFRILFSGTDREIGYEEAFGPIHPEDRQRVRDGVAAAIRPVDPIPYAAEYRVVHPDGTLRWLSATGHANFRSEGTASIPTSLDGTVIDITERKRAEEERERLIAQIELDRSNLRAIFEQAPAIIAVLRGPDLVFEYVNEGYYQVTGHRPMIGLTIEQGLPEATGGGEGRDYDRVARRVLETGERLVFSARPAMLQRTPGAPQEERLLDLAYLPLREIGGEVSGVLVHGIDVTDAVRSRRAIAEREELFRTVFEEAPDDAILVLDMNRVLTAWNPAAERITGWRAEEVVGKTADMIFTPEDRAQGAPKQETTTAAREGKAADERWHMHKDGTRFWGSGTLNALHDTAGSVRGYLKVFRDATVRYEEAKGLGFLRTLTDALIGRRDPEAIIAATEEMLGVHLEVNRALYGEFSPSGEEFTIRQEWTREVRSLLGTHRLEAFGSRIAANLREGRIDVIMEREREFTVEDGLLRLRAGEAGSAITVPVYKDERMMGVFAVNAREPRVWKEAEIVLVQQVANRLALELERARSEAALLASEERFRAAQETSPEPFAITEAVRGSDGRITDFRWTYVNPAFERMTGESKASMIGSFVVERQETMRDTDLFKAYVRAVETGEPFTHEMPIRYGERDFYLRLAVSKVDDGAATTFTDLTERYVEAQALAFLGLMTEAVTDLREPDRILSTIERMAGAYLGASRVTFGEFAADEETFVVRQEWGPEVGSLLGTYGLSAFGPRAAETLRAGRTYVLRDASVELGEEALAASQAIEALATISVPVMKDGRLSALFIVHQDAPREWTEDEIGLVQQIADRMASEIERARAEAALRTSEERFRQLVNLAPSTVWFGETDGGLSFISQEFYDITGLTPEAALPNGWVSVVLSEDLPRVSQEWETALREGTPYDTEFRIRHRDGVYRWISARALPVRAADGHVIGWLGSNSDIQEQKETEEILRARVEERTEELQRAVREAEGFNYSISHDLRTPLRAMVSTSSILLEDLGSSLGEEHRGLLMRQVENAKRLGRLIDELLRLSRLARVPVNRTVFDMTQKARSVAEEILDSGGVKDCIVDVQEGMTAEGDPALVRTVLQNLIGNACKFSPLGGRIRVRETNGVFSVADEGVGFDMQFAPKVFLPFERLVPESEFEGTGIGLANVKRIIERHGGRVWVESAPGKGSTFSFTLEAPSIP